MDTYRARLKGNLLEWLDEKPPVPESDSIEVDVVVLPGEGWDREQGARMAGALEKLAGQDLSGISDAAAWERELRADRPLSGR